MTDEARPSLLLRIADSMLRWLINVADWSAGVRRPDDERDRPILFERQGGQRD